MPKRRVSVVDLTADTGRLSLDGSRGTDEANLVNERTSMNTTLTSPTHETVVIRNCHFRTYSTDDKPGRNISLEDVIAMDDIISLPEDSGCESGYVEIAKWSHKSNQWYRFAFEKMMDVDVFPEGGEDTDNPLTTDCMEKAAIISGIINEFRLVKLIATLPNWEGE